MQSLDIVASNDCLCSNYADMSSLQALAQLISNGVAKIESSCAADGQSYPSLDDPLTLESSRIQTQYTSEAAPIIAAAYQLIATLTQPSPYIFNAGIAVSVPFT